MKLRFQYFFYQQKKQSIAVSAIQSQEDFRCIIIASKENDVAAQCLQLRISVKVTIDRLQSVYLPSASEMVMPCGFSHSI